MKLYDRLKFCARYSDGGEGGRSYVHCVTDGVGAMERMYIIHLSQTLQLMPDGTNNQNASTYTYLPPEDVSSYFLKGPWSLVRKNEDWNVTSDVHESFS
jgi:hypothetical protein